MPNIRIFLSFDGDHDVDLRDQLIDQSSRPGSVFELSAHSQGNATTDAWAAAARGRIRAADEMIVICGEHTDASPRVAAELRIAQEEGRPYFLLWGRRELMCTKPISARPADGMYSWTWEILQSQILAVSRAERSDARSAAAAAKSAAGRPGTP